MTGGRSPFVCYLSASATESQDQLASSQVTGLAESHIPADVLFILLPTRMLMYGLHHEWPVVGAAAVR